MKNNIKFVRAPKRIAGEYARYDATVGMLHVGTQENGEGWWNWWVALAEQGPAAGDRAIVEAGGCPTLASAIEQIATECELVARRILSDLMPTEASSTHEASMEPSNWINLTNEQRLEFLSKFSCCRHCGDLDTSCQCWNDE